MLMSFLLTAEKLTTQGFPYLKRRMGRLLIPQVTWALVPAMVFAILDYGFGIRITRIRSLSTVGWQLLTGSTAINNLMWYMTALIVLTGLAALLVAVVKHGYARVCVLTVLTAVSIYLQQTGLNYAICSGFRSELSSTCGRIIEMIPYMCVGMLAAQYRWFDRLKEHWVSAVAMSILLFFLLNAMELFVIPEGFAYQGALKIMETVLLVTGFYVIPFDRLTGWMLQLIQFLSKYSLGIYCVHKFVGKPITNMILPALGWETNTLLSCFLIYGVSLLLSFAVSKLPGQWAKCAVM